MDANNDVSDDLAALRPPSRWELAIEAIVVKIRWFGLVVGYLLVNFGDGDQYQQGYLNTILTFGVVFTLIDTWHSARSRIFLGSSPLVISIMEALFISLLCHYHRGLESPFRFYYFLSLICCAIRHTSSVTYLTCTIHGVSYTALFLALPADRRATLPFVLTLVVILWVAWTSNVLSLLLKRVGARLEKVNARLREHQSDLEERIAERTRELQESQAHVMHQDKMAALGLLAAGIAHEVGNPLTSISSIVQLLQRHDHDEQTASRLGLISDQLKRIQITLRELMQFSRPPSTTRARVALSEIVQDAMNIARFHKRPPGLQFQSDVPMDLPWVMGARDQLVQVVLNLILNAVDATAGPGRATGRAKQAQILVQARYVEPWLEVSVVDNGPGLTPAQKERLFQPYFTTKSHGTGLGLFVTRKLIQEHGGTIEHEPNPEGGAIFRCCLPPLLPARMSTSSETVPHMK